jgi:hypothetical protein
LRRKSLDLWLEERELRREALELSRPTACELTGAPVYILARNPELKLGAKLALEILRETFKHEALSGLKALVFFDTRGVKQTLREARERCNAAAIRAMERAEPRWGAPSERCFPADPQRNAFIISFRSVFLDERAERG